MTAETLRDALLVDHAEMGYGHGPVYRARLDAIIAAARAESDALRAALCPCWQHRDGDYCCLGHETLAPSPAAPALSSAEQEAVVHALAKGGWSTVPSPAAPERWEDEAPVDGATDADGDYAPDPAEGDGSVAADIPGPDDFAPPPAAPEREP